MLHTHYTGSFYPASETALRSALEETFLGERGPGSLPTKKKRDGHVIAAIVPHAGYAFSGQAAAWAYHALGSTPVPDIYIILAPNHHSLKSGTSAETWETPLGMVRADQNFIRELVAKGTLRVDDSLMVEHAVEVQIPFLQFITPPEKLKIVPIVIGEGVDLKQLALDIKETLVEEGKSAVIIASSDFTHHGPDYQYVRFTIDTPKQIYEFDKGIIDLIKGQDVEAFAEFMHRELTTVCGAKPIELLLRLIKHSKATLEQYYTSGDLLNDYRNSVSYAAILFSRE